MTHAQPPAAGAPIAATIAAAVGCVVGVVLAIVGIAASWLSPGIGFAVLLVGVIAVQAGLVAAYVAASRWRRLLSARMPDSVALDVAGWLVPALMALAWWRVEAWLRSMALGPALVGVDGWVLVGSTAVVGLSLSAVLAGLGVLLHVQRARWRRGWRPRESQPQAAPVAGLPIAWQDAADLARAIVGGDAPLMTTAPAPARPLWQSTGRVAWYDATAGGFVHEPALAFGPDLTGGTGRTVRDPAFDRWRDVRAATLEVTSAGVVLDLAGERVAIDAARIRAVHAQPAGWYLDVESLGLPPIRIVGAGVPVLAVLLVAAVGGADALRRDRAFAALLADDGIAAAVPR